MEREEEPCAPVLQDSEEREIIFGASTGDSESVSEHEEKNPQEDGPENVEQCGTISEGFEENVFQNPDEEEAYKGQYMSETQQGDLPEPEHAAATAPCQPRRWERQGGHFRAVPTGVLGYQYDALLLCWGTSLKSITVLDVVLFLGFIYVAECLPARFVITGTQRESHK
ncbi:uncharacterized protein LOC115635776 isoform X2 [Gopherus evgoodei]|uniref:uncharacterized protein LOC115635776 isoform X2 n=1 Tax=Gopherus evgoodei TaxID=1825980 RepID=UPI0011CFD665|nr:uncharacterized protein LOC115635776 isoform X2 [Gopherus evgoodei]